MIFIFILNLLMSPHNSFAQSSCGETEINPYTGQVFGAEAWGETLDLWDRQQPPSASLWSLFWAHQVYQKELSEANTLKNDKRKHCYIGCRIAQETSIEVSTYVGWLKESEDLQDCDRKTFFEPLDYQSTVDGALHSEKAVDSQACMDYCRDYTAPKTRLELQ